MVSLVFQAAYRSVNLLDDNSSTLGPSGARGKHPLTFRGLQSLVETNGLKYREANCSPGSDTKLLLGNGWNIDGHGCLSMKNPSTLVSKVLTHHHNI